MIFGVTLTGFNIKRLENIRAEIDADLKSIYGDGVNLEPESPLGQHAGTFADREASLWEKLEELYNAAYPNTAQGVALDEVVSITAIARLGARKSTVTVRVDGTPGTLVPVGFVASVDINNLARFETTAAGNISALGIDEVQDITFDLVPDSGTWKITFSGDETGVLAFNISAAALETALEALPSIGAGNISVAGDFTLGFTCTFQAALAALAHPQMTISANSLLQVALPVTVTVTKTTKGTPPFIDLAAEQESDPALVGGIVGNSGSITVIETPTAGVDGVTNLLDAEVGRGVETDAQLRARRATELQRSGTAALDGIKNAILKLDAVNQAIINENPTSVPVGGLPPHSFESVVDGGDEQEIADTIFRAKAAGIQTEGTISKTVADASGNNHTVKFSRPTAIAIHVIANIVGNVDPAEGALYPVNGDALVEQAILDYGASLTIGKDVINNNIYTFINQVPGVIGIELLIDTAPAPAVEQNVAIALDELADFDSSRITVNS